MHGRYWATLFIVIVPTGCAVGAAPAAGITLAHDGKPAATIVVPARPAERVALAAHELQHFVRAICGVELPIHRDGQRVPGTGLYIGRCDPALDSDLPGADLNPESYAIRVRDGNVFFAGRYPTATYFAVASFIEDSLGVRWFAPGDVWESIPAGTPGELSAAAREVVKAPDTSPRFWSGHNFADSWETWNLRNKTVSGEHAPRRNFQNNLHLVFPPSKYAKTHPEYYPLIDGKRWIPQEGDRYWRPCESNPDVVRLTVEAAGQHFDRHPDSDSFSLGMDDISHLCGCDRCRAMDPRPDSYEKKEFSDRHYKFVNTVAREIARTNPGRYVGTLIYAIARTPPETIDRLEDNVFGFITEVSASWCVPGHKAADHDITREWTRRCKHLSRYDYFGLGTFTPRYYPHWMAEQIKFDKSLGLEGMYAELNTFLPHTAPMIWAFAKLEWDASLDVDALLKEFMAKMFGSAAPAMARYFDLLERAWNDPPPGRTDWEHRDIFMQAQAIAPEAVEQGMSVLNEATAQANDDDVRKRIETIRAGLQYAAYAIRAYAMSEKVIAAPLTNAEQVSDVTTDALKIMELSAGREPFWSAAMDRSDLLGENLRGLNRKGYLMVGRAPTLERGAGIGCLRVLDWYAQHAPAELPAIQAKLTSAPKGNASDLLRAWLWFQTAKPANLLDNPGFERPAASPPEAPSSHETLLPAGWSVYTPSHGCRAWLEPGAGRAGTTAACLTNAQSGCHLQAQPARPGERYLAVAYVANRPDGTDGHGYLSIRFQKPDGSWHPRVDLEPRASMIAQPGWQPLMVLATVPEGAGRILVLVGAREQPRDSTILCDDIGLYRLPD